MKRKLTALMSADAVGYSRLMGDDEAATVKTLAAFKAAIAAIIARHRGRVIDAPGDNILSEFASVVNAVDCAAEIQTALHSRNAELPPNRRMQFRIGINLGDVIEEDGRLFGDGVNIAARLEGLCDAGGICITGSAYDQVKNKLPFSYKFEGEQLVKNIKEPVRVYRVLTKPGAPGTSTGAPKARPRRWQGLVLASAILAALGAAVLVIWSLYGPRTTPPPHQKTSVLPKRPSIAVLPFANLSQDPQQEYFSDGITNDIITDLSKFRYLFVVASSTVFTYKGRSVRVTEVGQELGVQYVLAGSVQEAGERVRINVQLTDAVTGNQIWAQRYDRPKNELFALQEEIIQTIVGTLAIKLEATELARVMRKDTTSYQAYDYFIRANGYQLHHTRSANSKARQLLEKAIELDPQFASAYTALGWCYHDQVEYGWTEFIKQALQHAISLAQEALRIDNSQASAHELLGSIYIRQGRYDLAITELQHALALNPNDSHIHSEMGEVLLYAGHTDDAIKFMEAGLRFNPKTAPGIHMELGMAYYLKARYDEAVKIMRQGLAQHPEFAGHHIVIAAAYAQLGRTSEAHESAQQVLRRYPFFRVESYGTIFQDPSDRKHLRDGLLKAGLK